MNIGSCRALSPIAASLAHDETAEAEVQGRGPVFKGDRDQLALCSMRICSADVRQREREGEIQVALVSAALSRYHQPV